MEQQWKNRARAALVVIILQVAAAIYFLADAINESGAADGGWPQWLSALDLLVGLALLAGIAYAALTFRRMLDQAKRHEEALAIASGAMATLIEAKFTQWGLSHGEAEVALFALKGFSPTEIAELRGSATGTVRSQLSAVYAKADVTGQPMLMALFLDDLLQ